MRLWDYRLLKVLPDKFIIAEWRECIAIKRQWEKGTLKHRLVSYVMDYPKYFFFGYVTSVVNEMERRRIKYNEKLYEEIGRFCIGMTGNHYPEHNNRYLRENLYNLEEKAMRNIISKEDWQKIYNNFKDFTDLWI